MERTLVGELVRKTLHLFALTIWLVNEWYGKEICLVYLLACLLTSAALELLRLKAYRFYPFKRLASLVARNQERGKIAAHVYFFLGALLSIVISVGNNGVASVLVAAISDAVAAITGLTIGKHQNPLNPAKKLEGTLVGAMFAAIIVFLIANGSTFTALKSIAAAIVFALLDSITIPVNDNLINPITLAITLNFLDFIMLSF